VEEGGKEEREGGNNGREGAKEGQGREIMYVEPSRAIYIKLKLS